MLLLLLVVQLSGSAQQITYAEWQEEAKTNIRLLPKYGNAVKTPGQKEADEELILKCLKTDGTRRLASEHLYSLGFKYLEKKDVRTAMYRFNQAWLLDSNNENAYQGFGAVYCWFNDSRAALKQIDMGLAINPQSVGLLCDKAVLYLNEFEKKEEKEKLEKASEMLLTASKVDPGNKYVTDKLALCNFYKSYCRKALEYVLLNKESYESFNEEFRKKLESICGK
ncbi:MAG: hypothetical protein V4543_16400 [Bacteroidota bacterium]